MTLNCSICCITQGCNCAMTCQSETFVGGIQALGLWGTLAVVIAFAILSIFTAWLVLPLIKSRSEHELGR